MPADKIAALEIPGFAEDHGLAPYLYYEVYTSYAADEGRLQEAVAWNTGQQGGADQDAEVLDLTSPTGLRVVEFAIARLGALPVVPDPDDMAQGDKLLASCITPATPTPWADGRHQVYAVGGIYIYSTKQPVRKGQGFKIGKSALASGSAVNNVIRQTDFGKIY
jgi:hypothetical protein